MKVLHILIFLLITVPVSLSISQEMILNTNFGGGEYIFKGDGFELTPEQRKSLLTRLAKKIEILKAQGIIVQKRTKRTESISLHWPLSSTSSDYGYHAMKYFVDHDPVYGQLRDYNDGSRLHNESDTIHILMTCTFGPLSGW